MDGGPYDGHDRLCVHITRVMTVAGFVVARQRDLLTANWLAPIWAIGRGP